MSDHDAGGGNSGQRNSPSQDTMAELLRLVRGLNDKIDRQDAALARQDAELVTIKLRLERGAASIEQAGQTGNDVREIHNDMLILKTKFAILWAGLGVAGTAGLSGLVMAGVALLRHP